MRLTAGRLIEELKKVPADTEINFEMDDGCCGDYMELDLAFAEALSYDKDTHHFRVRVQAIEGFQSCIKSGNTKKYIQSLKREK